LTDFSKNARKQNNENPSSGSQGDICGGKDRQKDMTKLMATFRNFANAPTNCKFSCICHVPHASCIMLFDILVFFM